MSKKRSQDPKEFLRFLLARPNGMIYQEESSKEPANNKNKELALLKEKYTGCTQCPLAKQGRSQVVFGTGNPNSAIMFVGEGPGRDEDMHGKPFVGRAGKLLTKIIEAMGFSRDDVYISNTVKCRPPNNRTPLPNEASTCIDLMLMQEIKIIQPTVICTLGATATQALLGPETRISKVRGQFIQVENIKILPTYHPAYLLRNPSAKKIVWEDMQKILQELKT